jgi:hypothetical protein
MRPQVKTTILVAVLGLSLALNVSLAIGFLRKAGTRDGESAGPDARGTRCLLDRLQLDHPQRQRLLEMRREMQKRRAAFWQRSAAIKTELAGAICAAGPSHPQLDALLDRYAKNQAQMQRAVADHLLGVNAMLRPDQREKFRDLLRTEMFRGISSPATVVGEP